MLCRGQRNPTARGQIERLQMAFDFDNDGADRGTGENVTRCAQRVIAFRHAKHDNA